jgi:hypothetical protein
MDTLDQFLRGLDTAKVEAERFPTLAQVQQESFGSHAHRAMVADHEVEAMKFDLDAYRRSTAGDVHGAERLQRARRERYPARPDPSITATLAAHRAQQEFNEKETKK